MKKSGKRDSYLCRTKVTTCTRWLYDPSVPLSSSVKYVRLLRDTGGVHRIVYKVFCWLHLNFYFISTVLLFIESS